MAVPKKRQTTTIDTMAQEAVREPDVVFPEVPTTDPIQAYIDLVTKNPESRFYGRQIEQFEVLFSYTNKTAPFVGKPVRKADANATNYDWAEIHVYLK